MATINVLGLDQQHPRHSGGFGNTIAEHYTVSVDAAGKVNGVDLATGDVIRLGILRAGWKLIPSGTDVVVSDAFGADVTGALGFAYTDGNDHPGVPQDNDYFLKSSALSTAAILRGNNEAVTPVVLPKNAYLTLTLGGTSHDATTARLDVVIKAVDVGLP